MASPASLLALIDTAIEALVTGGHESYSIGQRSVTKLDLKSLFEERRILQGEVNRAANGHFRLAKLGRISQ